MPFLHFDEARAAAVKRVREWVAASDGARALLIVDLFGKIRLSIWGVREIGQLDSFLAAECGSWWTGEVLKVEQADDVTRKLYAKAWEDARKDPDQERTAVLDRHRSRTTWFTEAEDPPWGVPAGPPLIVFYSFKGGLGRSTLLASFAIQRARAGERVCVIDLDLDSPGIGSLLSADVEGRTARWGVVDFLLERSLEGLPLEDYHHRCDRVAGSGEIVVFPAGYLDQNYAEKLARVDLEGWATPKESGLRDLLDRIRAITPQWILVDARTGISEPAGALLSGLAHLNVLLGTTHRQSWQGLSRVVGRLGEERVLVNKQQADVLLVQAMVPAEPAGALARTDFLARAENEFTKGYYVELSADQAAGAEEEDDRFWDMRDIESLDAPHVPVAIDYDQRLAAFVDVAEVADHLSTGPYASFAERVVSRFSSEAPS